jgi:hypothetical protein
MYQIHPSGRKFTSFVFEGVYYAHLILKAEGGRKVSEKGRKES